MEGSIAMPDWEACESCKNFGDDGCQIEIELEPHRLGDWIICKQYENNQEIQPTEESG